jgi:hypothetical protein
MNKLIVNDLLRDIKSIMKSYISDNKSKAAPVAITPNNSTDIGLTKQIYVGNNGDLNLEFEDGSTVLFSNVQNGTTLSIRATKVLATNTTATGIVAIY